jgi:hypothetical protein
VILFWCHSFWWYYKQSFLHVFFGLLFWFSRTLNVTLQWFSRYIECVARPMPKPSLSDSPYIQICFPVQIIPQSLDIHGLSRNNPRAGFPYLFSKGIWRELSHSSWAGYPVDYIPSVTPHFCFYEHQIPSSPEVPSKSGTSPPTIPLLSMGFLVPLLCLWRPWAHVFPWPKKQIHLEKDGIHLWQWWRLHFLKFS